MLPLQRKQLSTISVNCVDDLLKLGQTEKVENLLLYSKENDPVAYVRQLEILDRV